MPSKRLPEVLGEYARLEAARFHMPGHKGRGMGGFFSTDLMGWDVTELSFSDDLSNPEGVLLHAQQAAAAQYGAAHTFFLVNGATAGLHAMLLALPKGARLLVGRDCHRAVLAGAALAEHTVHFVQPAALPEEGLFGCVTAAALERALQAAPADAVVITSPTYYGLCADIPALSAVAWRHGARLLVDAAHGAHFPFSKELPAAPAGYADAWVNSAHKTLNAMGQAALLHIGPGMDADAVQRALSLLQTSSPSYLLLASLDWARYTAGRQETWTQTARACRALSGKLSRVLGIRMLSRACIGQAGIADMDPTRLVIDVSGRGISGYDALRQLEQLRVFVEFADSRRLVLICTPADDPKWYPRLAEALERLAYGLETPADMPVAYPGMEQAMPLAEAIRAPMQMCLLAACAGRIAAECAGIYPPGIPLWAPGERITAEAVEWLAAQQAAGAGAFGIRSGATAVVKE